MTVILDKIHQSQSTIKTKLKNNKAVCHDGLPTCFRPEVRSMHQLIDRIWPYQIIPTDLKLSALGPVLKRRDPTICVTNWGTSPFPIAFKVITSALCGRLKSIAKTLIVSYQCGFRLRKSTIDQKFILF